MLQVSDTAAALLHEARDARELPETFGVRVFGQPNEAGQIEVALAFSDEPAEADEVTEQAGTQIFIAPEVAEPLAESVIDFAETPEGPQLVIKPQDDAGS